MNKTSKQGILEIILKSKKRKPFYHRRKTFQGELITTNNITSAKVIKEKDVKKLAEEYINLYGMENINQIKFNQI